jgi:hypothetical protein
LISLKLVNQSKSYVEEVSTWTLTKAMGFWRSGYAAKPYRAMSVTNMVYQFAGYFKMVALMQI